ncbi:P-loop containing nucleoside triphosphate hydrolase protein [Amanita muscaria]
MPSLTRCSVQAIKASERLTASTRRLLQSSASCKKSDSNSRSSSRTRLTRDLTPRSNSGRIVVAPKRFDTPSDCDPIASKNLKQWTQSTISKIRTSVPIFNELYNPPSSVTFAPTNANSKVPPSPLSLLPTRFISPPLMPGFVTSLAALLGDNAKPTPIQALSIRWLIECNKQDPSDSIERWKQFLLASETGSGKSIAYLLPVLQHLKESELQGNSVAVKSDLDLNPRALILAPTHELSRQLSKFAKKLSHGVKLRVLCASQANVKNTREKDASVKTIRSQLDQIMLGTSSSTEKVEARKTDIPVDVVVGTPTKLLEMVRGRGWNREEADAEDEIQNASRHPFGFTKGKPEMGLANVQWVVVDEADVLFDPDFQEYTRMLLAEISAARGVPVAYSPDCSLSASEITGVENSEAVVSSDVQPLNYSFNLILTAATIPSALVSYLDKHHPNLTRLVSPNLHHLPKTLRTEHVAWSGGNHFADIEGRIRRVWADDSVAATTPGVPSLSKVLIFCNKSTKVTELGEYLTQKGIKNIALTSTSEQRKHGSNKHLEGFLQPLSAKEKQEQKKPKKVVPSIQHEPHVMITTSLLSRGLDFSPEIKHVFIVDQPRNMIDFLHRAGRSGRAGEKGKVVIFGKMKGRGSAQAKEARKRVGALVA